MTISARLSREAQSALERFCKAKGVTKTQAIERGIGLLLEIDASNAHPAFVAYKHLKLVPEDKAVKARRSSDYMRAAIRAKYSR